MSDGSDTAIWYNRAGYTEDPWVSLLGYDDSNSIVYAGAS